MSVEKHYFNFKSIDEEKRQLRIKNDVLKRSLVTQQGKNQTLEEENRKLKQEITRIEKEKQKLKEEVEKIRKQRDTYRDMVFKANRKKEEGEIQTVCLQSKPKRKAGGQIGHRGYGRNYPERVDRTLHIFTLLCSTCKGKLNRSQATVHHTVEDIPTILAQQTIVTRYEIERQWCKNCKKEMTVIPNGVIPGSRLGMNLLLQVVIWKYLCRIPLNIIVALLEISYDLHVSEGTLVLFLKRTSRYLGKPYSQILAEVRASPVKHADETSWRVNGQNNWCWAFLKKDAVYYTIEETRGKGIAEKILKDCHPEDVLVRDDYAGYKKLAFVHQSCWAHLLRESHKEANQSLVSEEMKHLHTTVKEIYAILERVTKEPFVKEERQRVYATLLQQIQTISQTPYTAEDAKKIQYRITSQNKNLLTALLYPDVPLTNNLAERAIRPLVVTRKISGGSRSSIGAKTHAINMSVLQTMKMKKESIPLTLHNYFLKALGNN